MLCGRRLTSVLNCVAAQSRPRLEPAPKKTYLAILPNPGPAPPRCGRSTVRQKYPPSATRRASDKRSISFHSPAQPVCAPAVFSPSSSSHRRGYQVTLSSSPPETPKLIARHLMDFSRVISAPTSFRLTQLAQNAYEMPMRAFQNTHETHPSLPHLVLLVFEAVLEVVCVSLPGYIVARLGHFDAEKQKFLANLNVMLFTPCLSKSNRLVVSPDPPSLPLY